MSLKLKLVLITFLINTFNLSYAQDTVSIWANLDTPQAQITSNDYKTTQCTIAPPKPYTGALLIESKYNQADPNKTTLVTASKSSKEIENYIKNYIKGLLTASKKYRKANKAKQANEALACLSYWLDGWAKANALLNPEATKTGIAGRKWALAAISAIILNTQGYSNGKFELTTDQKRWLKKLAEQVIQEYEPRRANNFTGYFNNHDYWAGWAVSATGMVLQNKEMIIWGHTSLQRALQQVIVSNNGQYAWLPYEVARGKLAADYSNYAMIPLMLLADTAKANQLNLTADELKKLQLLGNFTALTVLNPKSLPELPGKQSTVKPYKMIWVIPFINSYPTNNLAKQLYSKNPTAIDNYSQISGSIKYFYPNVN
ncbi:alginate lyase family protein [Entomomonas asaccharolytica]|uniref:Alginate lyase family protein n=1 Tax=Entomomonas asaccharolytica TaxID=2785331 RepID=A0A974NCS2_9GAMM|nr:alginate lyase family protein [Entomomonas asaccharolytica]QQP84356.1 alginate lyase family protein [Entomomonas asaccharolytica]